MSIFPDTNFVPVAHMMQANERIQELEAEVSKLRAEREEAEHWQPKKRIDGCRHEFQRMKEWVDEGACPICMTASAGMNNERVESAEADARELWERLHYESGRCFVSQSTYAVVEKHRAKYGSKT